MNKRKRPLRGFAVLVVMLVGVVAIVLALALLTTFGTTAFAHSSDDSALRTEAASLAALTQTAAWLDEISRADGDLDRALSTKVPSEINRCDEQWTFDVSPTFATLAPIRIGKRKFAHLQIHGVNVYVAVVDNRDDGATGGPRSKGACAEGAASKRGVENFARDDDKRVWILVIAELPSKKRETENDRGAAALAARRVKRALYDDGALYIRALDAAWTPPAR